MAGVAHRIEEEEEDPGALLRDAVAALDDSLRGLESSVIGRLDRDTESSQAQNRTILELRAELGEERRIRRHAARNLDQVIRILRKISND